MAMEKKSLVSKKTVTPTKKSKIDTSKPTASKVVAAKPSLILHGNK